MWIKTVAIIYGIYVITQQCDGLNFVELPGFSSVEDDNKNAENKMNSDDYESKEPHDTDDFIMIEKSTRWTSAREEPQSDYQQNIEPKEPKVLKVPNEPKYPPVKVRSTTQQRELRRHWLVSNKAEEYTDMPTKNLGDKDASLKIKISNLVEQTMHDTNSRIKSVEPIKERNKDRAPYKIGFILSLVKKSRDVLNELFNVAVKHRDEWKALEQLKIFELIVHTNVDTTNLVRQLVEIHIQHLNTTKSESDNTESQRRRVVLL